MLVARSYGAPTDPRTMGQIFQVSERYFFASDNAAPVGANKNCTCHLYCKVSVLGIGYSFQLAITTPRMNLIGYGTATAQS